MTRKDFEDLAAVVASLSSETEETDRMKRFMAYRLADFCKARNVRFDRDRFLIACGCPWGEKDNKYLGNDLS